MTDGDAFNYDVVQAQIVIIKRSHVTRVTLIFYLLIEFAYARLYVVYKKLLPSSALPN